MDISFWIILCITLLGILTVPIAAAYDLGKRRGYALREREQVEFEERLKQRLKEWSSK